MASYYFVTNFPKLNDFRFHMETPETNVLYNTFSFDEASLADSILNWQQANAYAQKKIFPDLCTIMVHTQANTGIPLPYPDLDLLNSRKETIANLSVSPFTRGAQQISGYVDTNPYAGVVTQLNSYLWAFAFSDLLTAATDSGIYYLRLSNNSADGLVAERYITEPILVYGANAFSFPECVLIQSQNNSNRAAQWWITSGWDGDYLPTAQHRVEAHTRPYSPKGIYVGMLEQEYQPLLLNAQNYRSFTLDLGGQSQGVPDYIYEKIGEAVITDYWTKDGITYEADVTDTDASIKQLWKGRQPEPSQLGWYTLQIRERFNSQYVSRKTVVSPCTCPILISRSISLGGSTYSGVFVFDMSAGFGCPFTISGVLTSTGIPYSLPINSLADFSSNVGDIYTKRFVIGGTISDLTYSINMVGSGALCDSGTISYGCVGPAISSVSLIGGGLIIYELKITYASCGDTCNDMDWTYDQELPSAGDSGSFTDTVPCPPSSPITHTVTPVGVDPGDTVQYKLSTTDCCGVVRTFTVSKIAPCSGIQLHNFTGSWLGGIGLDGGSTVAILLNVFALGSDCNSFTMVYTQMNTGYASGVPDNGTVTRTPSMSSSAYPIDVTPNTTFTGYGGNINRIWYHIKITTCCGVVYEGDTQHI